MAGDKERLARFARRGVPPSPLPLSLGEPDQTRFDPSDGFDHLVRGVERGFVRGFEPASGACVLVLRGGDGGRGFCVRDRSRVEPGHPRSARVVRWLDAGKCPGCGQADLDDDEQRRSPAARAPEWAQGYRRGSWPVRGQRESLGERGERGLCCGEVSEQIPDLGGDLEIPPNALPGEREPCSVGFCLLAGIWFPAFPGVARGERSQRSGRRESHRRSPRVKTPIIPRGAIGRNTCARGSGVVGACVLRRSSFQAGRYLRPALGCGTIEMLEGALPPAR